MHDLLLERKVTAMTPRPLGQSGLDVMPLCFGGNVFGWTADETTSHALLDRFVGAGLDFIDTANVYSAWVTGHRGGESESVIGRWLKKSGQRGRVVIATKVGMEMPGLGKGLTRGQIERGVEDSLRRLHSTPPAVAIAWVIAQPTITAAIASATSLAQLEELLAATRFQLDDDALRALAAASAP